MSAGRGGSGGRLLIVEDEELVLRAYVRVLQQAGFEIDTAENGVAATLLLEKSRYDAVVSDISMPGMDGVQLLRVIRDLDADVPVVLITAVPTLATAVRAIEFGAMRYLIKPIDAKTLESVVRSAVQLSAIGRVKRQIVEHIGRPEMTLADLPSVERSFARALRDLYLVYQPIVSARDGTVYGHEALVRASEPTLPHPAALLGAADRVGRLVDLGRAIRAGVESKLSIGPGHTVFVNVHPMDLTDDSLYDETQPFSRLARSIVLEITERAALNGVANVAERLARLREMGFRLAIDDLGAGYAGLSSFAQLEPEVVKLDISLVHGIVTDPIRRKLVHSMTNLCHDMGMQVIAEGIETREEFDVVRELGCDLLQGFFIARPGDELLEKVPIARD